MKNTKLSNTVELVLETHFMRIAKVISGWDKGAILIQNRATSFEDWSTPIRMSKNDLDIFLSNLNND